MSGLGNDLRESVIAGAARWQDRLRELVLVESPTEDAAAVNRAMDLAAGWAAAMGARVVRHPQTGFGDVVELWFGAGSAKPLMLLGHLDTVWPMGTIAGMPWRQEPDAEGRVRLWGPGVLDMKAGVVMAMAAVEAVLANGGLPRPVVLLLNPDEETGSEVSRGHTERIARGCEAVFVLEPAQGLPGSADNAAYKTARKGVGAYRLDVTGVAAHSGVDFQRGHSAVLELARLLQKVAAFTDLPTGLTVNPGVIGGGTRSNVVAAHAWAEVDVRIARAEDAARVDRLFQALTVEDPACSLRVSGGINRPPMERGAGTVRLFAQARSLAEGLGFSLDEASTGGGSDGNFTAGLGIPTLDGMGAVGEGAHAAHESLLLDALVPRTALLAAMIAST
ncbi:acetylornithine deacetylase/succinyldiaminopimelate desuccinylase-like deacylase [Terriglobus roseus DSM 18391]|uniref:Acetylornithine deacetylase/succinyldiaminopimelate desuccinylase-like deacylase n=1 Tax=Terriglobus roseus (strain DSM 18391 / NRRL B-41598 / KBS 63) TaxID=926566 RepID=I3ZAX0_TERRK|nr:M20 family metallopeptidase [Terriglobus roseus]AFL86388.1 acetylornithine deacetylase/succinyldiaminopimelate desuccinylase-like deacylase [Terriglobus roseus DSM 18391]